MDKNFHDFQRGLILKGRGLQNWLEHGLWSKRPYTWKMLFPKPPTLNPKNPTPPNYERKAPKHLPQSPFRPGLSSIQERLLLMPGLTRRLGDLLVPVFNPKIPHPVASLQRRWRTPFPSHGSGLRFAWLGCPKPNSPKSLKPSIFSKLP